MSNGLYEEDSHLSEINKHLEELMKIQKHVRLIRDTAYVIPYKDESVNTLLANLDKLLFELQSQIDKYKAMIEEKSKIYNPFIMQVYEVIDQNIDNSNFKLNDICRAVFLERTQVYRKIKQYLDTTPTELIRKKRLFKACKLLIESNLSISEIAQACGFSNLAYFDKVFRDYFDKCPSEWRAESNI